MKNNHYEIHVSTHCIGAFDEILKKTAIHIIWCMSLVRVLRCFASPHTVGFPMVGSTDEILIDR